MQLLFHRVDLRLRHTFTIAHDSRDVQPTLIIELRDDEDRGNGPRGFGRRGYGHRGFGEATATRYYGITIDGMVAALEALRSHIEAADLADPDAFWSDMQPHLAQNPFALCALDQAAWDL